MGNRARNHPSDFAVGKLIISNKDIVSYTIRSDRWSFIEENDSFIILKIQHVFTDVGMNVKMHLFYNKTKKEIVYFCTIATLLNNFRVL